MNKNKWIKSEKSTANMQCVEVLHVDKARDSDMVMVRNGRFPNTVMICTEDEWRAFIDGVKNNEFDLD